MKNRFPKPKKWIPKNKDKYKGNPYDVWVRSSWEKRFCDWLDKNDNVIQYSSEEIVICYTDPMGQKKRYFPDFYVKLKNKEGVILEYLIEIKPFKQTIEPEVKSKITRTYINEVYTWGINSAKWEAARQYCKKKKWIFRIMTEHDLFGKAL